MPNPVTTTQTIHYQAFMRLAGVIALMHGTPDQMSKGQLLQLATWLQDHNPKFDRVRWLAGIEHAITVRSAHNG